MRKRGVILFLCAFMAIATLGGAAASMPQASAEENSDVIQLVTVDQPVTSAWSKDLGGRQAVTLSMGDQTINEGDVLSLTYTISTSKGAALKVGSSAETEAVPTLTTSGTWSYMFPQDCSGDILVGVWSTEFTVNSATLERAKEPVVENGNIQLTEQEMNSHVRSSDSLNEIYLFAKGRSYQAGDTLTLQYSMAADPGDGKIPELSVGANQIPDTEISKMTEQTGTWSYTFTQEYSGVITLGLWGTSFTISSATLTPAVQEPVTDQYDVAIFDGVTQAPDTNNRFTMGTTTVSVKADGVLTFGQFEDDSSYYITATKVGSIARVDLSNVLDLEQAYLDGATLKFSAKFEFASEQNRKAYFRVMQDMNDGDRRGYAETELELTSVESGVWQEFSFPLTSLNQICKNDTYGDSYENGFGFDWAKFRGIGFGLYSDKGTGETATNNVSFGKVRIEGERKDKQVVGLIIEGPTKTSYFAGDSFDPAGMRVYADLGGGEKVEVFNYTVTAPAKLAQDSEVVVSWSNNEKNVNITVTQEFETLTITEQPTKTAYKAGEELDLTGLKLQAVRGDDTKKDVPLTDADLTYTYAGQMLPEGATKVTFTYKGVSADLAITVAAYENSVKLFDADSIRKENGDPKDGWNINMAGKNVVSQATYDAATEDAQGGMRVITEGEAEGKYFSATAAWGASRIFEHQIADFDLTELYNDPTNQAVLAIEYSMSAATGTVYVGLANFQSDWNLYFKKVDITSMLVADGQWHTVYIRIADFYGKADSSAWNGVNESGDLGNVDFSKVAGIAVACTNNAAIDLRSATFKWNGTDTDAVVRSDTYAPSITYTGKMTFDLKAGDAAPTFAEATAFDNFDGDIQVTVTWSEGAVTDGKMNAGEHTATLSALDAAGNAAATYTITVNVEGDGQKEPGGDTQQPGGDTQQKPEKKGCGSAVLGGSVCIALIALGGAVLSLKKKSR